MDELLKEIRKRKALSEKFSADPNNSKEFRIYQGAYADALTFVLDKFEFSQQKLSRIQWNGPLFERNGSSTGRP